MLAASRTFGNVSLAKPVGETEKIGLVDGTQDRHGGPLDDFVLQCRDAQGPLATGCLGNVHSLDRCCSVCTPSQPFTQVLKVRFKVLVIGIPRNTVNSRGSFPPYGVESFSEKGRVANVVIKGGELSFPISSSS